MSSTGNGRRAGAPGRVEAPRGRLALRIVGLVAVVLAATGLFLTNALTEHTRQQHAHAAAQSATESARRLVETGTARALLRPEEAPVELPPDLVHGGDGITVWRDDGVVVAGVGPHGSRQPDPDLLRDVMAEGRAVVRRDRTSTAALHAYAPVATGLDGAGLVVEVVRDVSSEHAEETGGGRLVALTLAGAFVVLGAALVPLLLHHDRTLKERTRTLRTLLERESEAVERMNEVDRAKDAFLTAISHELRTPLQVIDGLTAALATHGERLDPDRVRHLVDRLSVNARRLDALLVDLLDVDRLARGGLEPRRRAVDVAQVVHEVVDRVDHTDRTVHLPTDAVEANVDPGHLERIVDHLVRNAVKYATPGSPVWVRLHRDDDGTELIVADEGPGIPSELRLRIFDPFFRVDDDRPDPGAGLGLALVRRLAEAHGGRVWVEDRPGGGAQFHVRLPDEGRPASPVDAWSVTAAVAG